MKAQKSCAAHEHIRKTYHASFWQILLKIRNFFGDSSKLTISENQFFKIWGSFLNLLMIRRSNIEALQYKRQIECNRITNDNQNINKTNEKHPKNYLSSRTPEDGRSLRSSITLWAEQLNIRFLLYESISRPLETILRQFTAQLRKSKIFAYCVIRLWVYSVAVNGRVLRTPLGHDLCSCHEQSRFWHGRGIIKSFELLGAL